MRTPPPVMEQQDPFRRTAFVGNHYFELVALGVGDKQLQLDRFLFSVRTRYRVFQPPGA